MKNFKTKITALTLSALMAFSFTGCSNPKSDIQNALKNSTKITSAESKTNIKLSLNMDMNSKDESELKAIGLDFKNLSLSFDSKFTQDKNKSSKSESNINLNLMNLALNFKAFADNKIDDNKVCHQKIYVEIPSIIANLTLGNMYSNVKYMYLNTDELNTKEGLTNKDTAKSVESLTKFSKSFSAFLNNYVDVTDKKLITKKDQKSPIILNGKSKEATSYEIKLSDSELKNFLKSYINSKDVNTDFLALLSTLSKNTNEKSAEASYKEFKENFNKNYNKLPRVLGDKGLVIDFSIADGYIVKTKLNINFAKTDEESKKVSDAGTLLMTTTYSKINDDSIKVSTPEINKNNSINLLDYNSELLK